MTDAVECVCFDLGNVICNFHFKHTIHALSQHLNRPFEAVADVLIFDDVYVSYERGEIDTDAFRAELGHRLGADLTAETFDHAWNAIFEGLRPEMADIIEHVARTRPVAILSNTNHSHATWWRHAYADALAPCTAIFTSHEIGARKPDAAAYRTVVDAIGCPPSHVLFFDDMKANIDGARSAGLSAVHVTDEETVPRTLRERGLLR